MQIQLETTHVACRTSILPHNESLQMIVCKVENVEKESVEIEIERSEYFIA